MSTALKTLTNKLASSFGMADAGGLMDVLKATAFKGQVNDAQMTALMIVANQYGLNPWTKEIYAFPDKNNGIVPVVGVDGWSRIINENPQFDGMDFESDETQCTCTIYRKDRSHPVRVTEYLSECRRDVAPWRSHPRRMLRHKAMIQCARLAFGYVGIYEQDEAERILDAESVASVKTERNPVAAAAANIPAGYAEYEAEHLPTMRDAALNGIDALTNAFKAMKESPLKSAFWTAHRDTLKAAAAKAVVIEAEVV